MLVSIPLRGGQPPPRPVGEEQVSDAAVAIFLEDHAPGPSMPGTRKVDLHIAAGRLAGRKGDRIVSVLLDL